MSSEEPIQVPMSYVLAWHPYSRSNDLPEEFGQFSKELEVVARSRGGEATVDIFSGRGIETGYHIAKTILQSVVFSMTDLYDMCLEQAEKIEPICTVNEHDMIANVKGLEKGERVPIHFGPIPESFDSLCEFLICDTLRRVVEMWMAIQYVKAAKRVCAGEVDVTVPESKKMKFLSYIATELSEDPLIIDDELIDWISAQSNIVIQEIDAKFQKFKTFKTHRISAFIFMLNWSQFYVNIYSQVLTICEIVYTSYGSSSRWDMSPLLLPIIVLSAGAVSDQRTIQTVFHRVIPEHSPRMRAHCRLLLKLFPS